MPPIPVVSSHDGPKITVNDLIRDPLRLPTLIVDMVAQGFIADAVLRNAGNAESGAVRYNESTSPYADTDAVVRGEFAEVPIAQTSLGTPRVVYAEERALGIMVSDRMVRRRVVDPVTQQLQQVRNTLIRSWAHSFLNLLLDGAGAVVTGSDWSSDTTAKIRTDINLAKKAVQTAKDGKGASYGFKADVMIMGETAAFHILDDEQFNKPYQGNIADENLLYTGKLPNKVQALNVLVTPELDEIAENKVIVAQRGTCGFIADEVPMQASAVYRVEEKKSWRSDVQRASAMGLDQPKAVSVIELAGV